MASVIFFACYHSVFTNTIAVLFRSHMGLKAQTMELQLSLREKQQCSLWIWSLSHSTLSLWLVSMVLGVGILALPSQGQPIQHVSTPLWTEGGSFNLWDCIYSSTNPSRRCNIAGFSTARWKAVLSCFQQARWNQWPDQVGISSYKYQLVR